MQYIRAAAIIAAVSAIPFVAPSAADAQWFGRQRQATGYNTDYQADYYYQRGINREIFEQFNRASGGMDENGNYRQPVPLVFGDQETRDGSYEIPMQWNPNDSIIWEVQNGQVIRQDYILRR